MEVAGNLSYHIAGVLGPILILLAISEYVNLAIWKQVSATVVYLNGLFLLTAGTTIIHFHNRWVAAWPLVVTVLGWLIFALGVVRMFFPTAKQVSDKATALPLVTVLLLVGLFLTAKAYFP